jgi:REP element-mobilizing transposase RayT
MPNHYHFLIQVRTLESLNEKDFIQDELPRTNEEIQKRLNENFRRFQISYSKALNKQLGRKGGLFMHNYCRKEINDPSYMNQLVVYIHNNPVNAGLCNDPANWKYSSYNEILENDSNIIKPKTTMELFSGFENFLDMHLLKK